MKGEENRGRRITRKASRKGRKGRKEIQGNVLARKYRAGKGAFSEIGTVPPGLSTFVTLTQDDEFVVGRFVEPCIS
jgi:hypothetical protein